MWMTLHIENRAVVFIHTMIDYLFFMFLRESLPTEPLVWGGFSCIYRRCIYKCMGPLEKADPVMYLFQQPLCMAATLSSDNGQACAVELLVDVERIYVGHAADIVNHGHDSRFQMGRVYVIQAAHPAHQLAGVITFGM